jgi:spermidine/putrescine transport system substrate-binding protein
MADIDPRVLARLTSRRRFIGGGTAVAAAAILGPSFLAACSSDKSASGPSSEAPQAPDDDGSKATGKLRVSNWPLYMADGFVAAFQTATGLTVDYKEDFNDNEEWFAKNKEPLSRKQDIGADLVVPSQFMAARLIGLGWLNPISEKRWTNMKNLRTDLLEGKADPGRKYTAPYMSGMVGIAYNKAATGRDITKVDDMWDPAFKGKVSLLSDTQDGLGMFLMSQGHSPEDPTLETVQKAVDVIKEQKDKGQIRRFTGNDYADDLAAGNIVVAQAYSGDVVQLQKDNPDLKFVVPESGSGVGKHAGPGHHGEPLHHSEPEGRRGVDQLRLRPGQLRQTDRGHPLRTGAVRHGRRAEQGRSRVGQEPADQPAQGDAGQAEGLGSAHRRADSGIQQGLRGSHRRLSTVALL